MKEHRLSALILGSAMPVILSGFAGVAFAKSEIKGAAILDNACGKVAVKQMGLVHDGKIDEAEAYLRDRRQDFLAAGFKIRKLNQAYFAFYGSYGDGASGVNPIPRQLGWLRAASGSPGEFLHRVGQLTSAADLARAVGE